MTKASREGIPSSHGGLPLELGSRGAGEGISLHALSTSLTFCPFRKIFHLSKIKSCFKDASDFCDIKRQKAHLLQRY